jgi:hypothetical protein
MARAAPSAQGSTSGDTLFGAENTMNIERAKGVGHGRLYSGISNTNDSRHFVPGYYRAVPPGQKPFAHRGALQLS